MLIVSRTPFFRIGSQIIHLLTYIAYLLNVNILYICGSKFVLLVNHWLTKEICGNYHKLTET